MTITVSINCITYNHEKYISKTIEGFLKQKANFDFEILIHDDASTDNTVNIIKEYQILYPDKIYPYFQNENQYSKGVNTFFLNIKKARGKYIADCEGDDYWIDEYKLQRQVDYLMENPDCSLCFHNAIIINEFGVELNKTVLPSNIKDQNFSAGDMLLLGFIPTASRVYLKAAVESLPDWLNKYSISDFPSQLIISNFGYAHYISSNLSAYRSNSVNSATNKFINSSVEEQINYIVKFIEIIRDFDLYSNGIYQVEVEQAIIQREVLILELGKNKRELRKMRYKEYFRKIGLINRAKFIIRFHFRTTYFYLHKKIHKLSKMFKRNNGSHE